jgi:hypothetical protein
MMKALTFISKLGKHAGHWGGDNTSLFAYMYFSISQALNFALFGIPMVGELTDCLLTEY